MLRILLSGVLAAALLPLSAQAREFRCFGKYDAEDAVADLLIYGDTDKAETDAMKVEFISDNGFYGVVDFTVKSVDFVEGKRLNLRAETESDPNFRVQTRYNPKVGDYRGKISTKNNGKTASFDVRCVILRGI